MFRQSQTDPRKHRQQQFARKTTAMLLADGPKVEGTVAIHYARGFLDNVLADPPTGSHFRNWMFHTMWWERFTAVGIQDDRGVETDLQMTEAEVSPEESRDPHGTSHHRQWSGVLIGIETCRQSSRPSCSQLIVHFQWRLGAAILRWWMQGMAASVSRWRHAEDRFRNTDDWWPPAVWHAVVWDAQSHLPVEYPAGARMAGDACRSLPQCCDLLRGWGGQPWTRQLQVVIIHRSACALGGELQKGVHISCSQNNSNSNLFFSF